MRKTTIHMLSIGCLVFGVSIAASPLLMGQAPVKGETQKTAVQNQDQQDPPAPAEVAKSPVGSIFLAAFRAKEPAWVLDKAGFIAKGSVSPFTILSMSLKKRNAIVSIDIVECDSPKDADALFDGPRSYGGSVPITGFGERADKLIGQSGDLLAIRFRKGNYFVAIWTRNQKTTAEKFAKYVLQSLGNPKVTGGFGQKQPDSVIQGQKLEPAGMHPELVADILKVAKAKIFLSKSEYRLDELMKLDVGLLVDRTGEYYFPSELNYRISVRDSKGTLIPVEVIFSVERTPEYLKVRGDYVTHSTTLFIGCNSKILKDFERSVMSTDSNDAKALFDANIFSPPANACLDIRNPGELTLTVEVFNDVVVLPETNEKTKTLTGSVLSNELKLRIVG